MDPVEACFLLLFVGFWELVFRGFSGLATIGLFLFGGCFYDFIGLERYVFGGFGYLVVLYRGC